MAESEAGEGSRGVVGESAAFARNPLPNPPPEYRGREEDATGLGIAPTWKRVYLLVVAAFCLWVAGLIILERMFS
jgi:hypothetical protein